MLPFLVSNASNSNNNGFYATNTTGIISDSGRDAIIYGLFLCRGDKSVTVCHECVKLAAKDLTLPHIMSCPNDKAVIMYYDNCMVRYSNTPILGIVNETSNLLHTTKNQEAVYGIDPKDFMKLAGNTIHQLVGDTWKGDSKELGCRKYYKTTSVNITNYVTLYGQAQCSPDLAPHDCARCLDLLVIEIPKYCNGSNRGCHVFHPSCNTRYEVYRFYDEYTISPPPATQPSPGPPPPSPLSAVRRSVQLKIVIPIGISVLVIVMVLILAAIARKKRKNNDISIFERADGDDPTIESLQCRLGVLQAATNNFDDDNMIGKGGFGVVFKGTLPNRKHIAIKKLFRRSLKVEEEFKNEMKVVARLQHRNLVKLLAFCLDRGERLLVFEYVPNKNLDHFIFEAEMSKELDWRTRFNIIEGIARGLLYLHEDSRLTIIHRDLKPSNILLEYDMKPKIADFGMARIFGMDQTFNILKQVNGESWQHSGEDQTHQSTSNIGGTLGYMAPDYVKTQRFSVKTDVYSFGVIILEIISGKRNRTFHQSGLATDLLSYAWTQLREGTPLKLIDARLGGSYIRKEVIRCIHLGLLCVQNDPNARPSMRDVVHIMLNTSLADDLPLPQLPPFFPSITRDDESSSTSNQNNSNSVNDVSITEQHPR